MKVLIVGGGGREHALAWKAAQSNHAEIVYVAPGNAGTAKENKIVNIDIAAEDIVSLVSFASEEKIDLCIVGPEVPLVEGIVDEFNNAGLRCFGPRKNAARLEGSKSFAKAFLKRHKIPTADYAVFTETQEALQYLQEKEFPIVIKADGLAAGKGVVVACSTQEAKSAIEDMLAGNKFGQAGHRVVIEEFLQGEEASFIVMTDGKYVLPLASSQDHKARDEGDEGPNTGGMGAYTPAAVITEAMHKKVMQEVIEPTITGMAKDGNEYTGFLYAGLMINDAGQAKVLEFNCRFGDPETQPVIMRLQSDLVELCNAALDGNLEDKKVDWDNRAALGVVLASRGYPLSASKGDVIYGLDTEFADGIKIFHAGTRQDKQKVVTHGGRVLCVTALGDDVTSAQQKAYAAVKQIQWEGMFFRGDIGYRAVKRETDI